MMRIVLSVLVGLGGACSSAKNTDNGGEFSLSSDAFGDGDAISSLYTCDDADISPPLEWSGAPQGTVSFVLQLIDPDANDFLHWTVGGLPADTQSLAQGASPDGLPQGAWELANDFPGGSGYRGPCPPAAHTYEFTLYALDDAVDAPSTGDGLAGALTPHTLGTAQLHGVYGGDR